MTLVTAVTSTAGGGVSERGEEAEEEGRGGRKGGRKRGGVEGRRGGRGRDGEAQRHLDILLALFSCHSKFTSGWSVKANKFQDLMTNG